MCQIVVIRFHLHHLQLGRSWTASLKLYVLLSPLIFPHTPLDSPAGNLLHHFVLTSDITMREPTIRPYYDLTLADVKGTTRTQSPTEAGYDGKIPERLPSTREAKHLRPTILRTILPHIGLPHGRVHWYRSVRLCWS